MANETVQTGLHELQEKLKRLLDMYSALQTENRKLIAENKSLKEQIAADDTQIKTMQQQIAVAKSGIKSWHPEQKKLFVKRIDSYLKEIDKCLALINE